MEDLAKLGLLGGSQNVCGSALLASVLVRTSRHVGCSMGTYSWLTHCSTNTACLC